MPGKKDLRGKFVVQWPLQRFCPQNNWQQQLATLAHLFFFSKTVGEAQLSLALSELGWQLLLGVLLLVGALLVLVLELVPVLVLVVVPVLNIKF